MICLLSRGLYGICFNCLVSGGLLRVLFNDLVPGDLKGLFLITWFKGIWRVFLKLDNNRTIERFSIAAAFS